MTDLGEYDARRTTPSSPEAQDRFFEHYRRRMAKDRDRWQIQEWLRQGRSYNSIADLPSTGLVDNTRFTERARRMYLKLWVWSEGHFSSVLQDRCYHRLGRLAYYRRIERCQRIIKSLKETP